jgi:hypothetical protein
METANDSLIVYRELADHYERLGQVSMRDRFLMLAADAALEADQPAEAERLRQRLLATSRHHMLRPYPSFVEARRAPDVDTYLRDLKANYPLSDARTLLETLRAGQMAVEHGSTRPIPPTAPLIDVNSTPRRQEPPKIIPFGEEESAPAGPERPRAQPPPRPGRVPVPPVAGRLPVALPVARSVDPPAAPAPGAADATAPLARPAQRKQGLSGNWLSAALVVLIITTGLALAAFTFARPFLPSGWLP